MISLLKRFGVFSPSFHPDPGLWGGVFGQTCRAPALGKGSQRSSFLLNTLLHKLWARSYAGHGGSEGKASPPPQGAHLRRTDRHSHHHQNRECEEAQECAATNLPRKPRRGRRRRAAIQSSIPVKLSPWPAEAPGTRIPLSPRPSPGRGPGPRPHPPVAVLSADHKEASCHLQKPERRPRRPGGKVIKWDSSQSW